MTACCSGPAAPSAKAAPISRPLRQATLQSLRRPPEKISVICLGIHSEELSCRRAPFAETSRIVQGMVTVLPRLVANSMILVRSVCCLAAARNSLARSRSSRQRLTAYP